MRPRGPYKRPTPLELEEREKREEKKIVVEAPSCNGG
jgi:hypothetical protein